jgi:hypothetical protein
MSDYIQLARVIGNSCQSNISIHKDDFYTLCQKKPKNNIGLRKKSKTHHLPTFKTTDITIDYLCSDFVRFCLSLYKNYSILDCGELTIIPKQPIPISKELQEYIEDYLPDYYDIRTNRK